MTFLKQTLESSLLLRPWVSLAELKGLDLANWLRNSRLSAPFRVMGQRLGGVHPYALALIPPFRFILSVGAAGLFCLLAFAGTGVIGAVTGLLFGLALLGWLLFRPNILSRLTVIDVLVALFLASAALSTAFSSFFTTSLIGLAKMTTFVAGYVVFRLISEQGHKTIAFLLGLLTAIGLGESVIGLYQHINHIQPLATWSDPTINPELQMDRIFGTLQPSNPNLLAGFLIPCLASSAGLALMFLRKKTIMISAALLGITGLLLYALVLTGSRGGFLAIGVMVACMFAYLGHLIWRDRDLKPYRWMKPAWLIVLIVSILAMAGGIAASEKIRHRVTSIFAMREDSSISYRLNVYNSAMQMVQDNPVVGIGPGNGTFKLVYGLYMVPGYNALGSYSVPLEIAVEQGLIGLTIFLSLLLILIIRAALAMDSPHLSLREKLLVGALLTGILGSFMYGAFDTIWYRPSVNLLFWFMVAALAKLTEPRESNAFRGKL
ncbi:MAG TPA: O-antigen ligase family protein [Coleofasciculaceae cyanobacterium]|jgi:putative inorganic carbon (HCO3(-)) transporter